MTIDEMLEIQNKKILDQKEKVKSLRHKIDYKYREIFMLQQELNQEEELLKIWGYEENDNIDN